MSTTEAPKTNPQPPNPLAGLPGGQNIYDMARHLASNMSDEDKQKIQSMDMEAMINQVTQGMVGMMNPQATQRPVPNRPGHPNQPLRDPATKRNPGKIEQISDDADEAEFDEIRPRTKDLHFSLNVELKDLYNGKKKKLQIKRTKVVRGDNGKQSIVEEKKKIVIQIQPGMKDDQVIRFNRAADERPGYETGDVVITICENPHDYFEREGDNLFLVKTISIFEAYQLNFQVKHLDGRVLSVKSTSPVHSNDGLRKIPGEGMPSSKDPNQKGDLFIRFRFDFPDTLEPSKLESLKKIFPPLSAEGSDGSGEPRNLEDVGESDREALEDFSDSEDESDFSSEDEESEESDYSDDDNDDDKARGGARQGHRALPIHARGRGLQTEKTGGRRVRKKR